MSVTFRQWESDPLFSAAEVVQDSADRMDSIFRIFLHEQSLIQGDPTDPKLLTSIDYHRRDLATALGTTKWQLEDFERAVNLTAFSDRSNMSEHSISRHKQFIRAIEEQIVQVERILERPSTGIPERSTRWNLNEKDRDGLALFLSGGNPESHVAQHDTDNSIMRRFLDSSNASEFDEKSHEIIELKTEDIEEPHVNGTVNIDHNFDHLKKGTLRKVGSNYNTRTGFETAITIEDGNNEGGTWKLESSDSNAKSIFSKNKLRGSRSRLDIFGVLSNFLSRYGGKMGRTLAQRRNDKEVRTDFDQNLSSSYTDTSETEQGMFKSAMHLVGDYWRGNRRKWRRSNLFFLLVWAVLIFLFVFVILLLMRA